MIAKNKTFGLFLLLMTSLIWGGTFVLQKTATELIDPFFYSSARLFLGSFALIPILLFRSCKNIKLLLSQMFSAQSLIYGILAGIVLAFGTSLQQIGLLSSKVSNAGFLTSIYIILVPFFLIFFGKKIAVRVLIAATLVLLGIYLLSFKEDFHIQVGDWWIICSAIFWALHIIIVGRATELLNSFSFSVSQFFFGGVFAIIFSYFMGENISTGPIEAASWEILFGGILSISVAYTLQVIAQKDVDPEYCALIFSFEAIFATIFEMIILEVFPSLREILGILLIFFAILYSQKIPMIFFQKRRFQ